MEQLEGKAFAFVSDENTQPAFAVDGSPDTRWTASGFYSWWMYELDSVSHLEKIVLDTYDKAEYKYFIEASADSINWFLIAEKDTASVCKGNGDCWYTDCEAKFIRITFRYCSKGQTVGLGRFECWGTHGNGKISLNGRNTRFFAASCDEEKNFEEFSATDDLTNMPITAMRATDCPAYLCYRSVDFKDGCNEMQGYFGFPVQDKRYPRKLIINVELRIDAVDGPVIGKFEAFRQWVVFGPLACDIKETEGIHDVYLIVTHIDEGQSIYVRWLSFVKAALLPEPQPEYKELPQSDNYNEYIGLLHCHTCMSDGMNTPEYACDFAKNVSRLDFLGITEHSNLFDNPYDSLNSRKFRDIREYTEKKTEPGKFVALYGSETTWYNGFGHMNIYDEDNLYLNACQVKYNDSKTYYDTIKRYPHSINQWNHPWSCGYRHLDLFHPYDPELDKIMYLIEMNPEENPECGGLFYYIRALEEGYHVAPCGSQDNHKEDWGPYSSLRTGIVSPELSKEYLLDSIRHRRVYFTCAPNLKVQYRVNGKIMGSRIGHCSEYTFSIKAFSGDEGLKIKSVEILGKEGDVVCDKACFASRVDEKLCCFGRDDKYYFARVTLEDGSFAVTSPVWIE